MTTIRPYTISVPEQKLERLQKKLALCDFPSEQSGLHYTSWDQGVPVSELERLVGVWQTGYDWRKIERSLNQLPHFMTKIDVQDMGQFDIHLIHKKSNAPGAIPLLFLHGWPGSFLEVTKILDPLVHGETEDSITFDVVAPSLVDFGFSSASKVCH